MSTITAKYEWFLRNQESDKKFSKIKFENKVEIKDLSCSFCSKMLKDPIQLECGCRSCKKCFKVHGHYCDEEQMNVTDYHKDGSAIREILNLICFCLFEDEGCIWTGKVLNLQEHLNSCDYSNEIVCPYQKLKCNEKGNMKQITNHLDERSIYHSALVCWNLCSIEEAGLCKDSIKLERKLFENDFSTVEDIEKGLDRFEIFSSILNVESKFEINKKHLDLIEEKFNAKSEKTDNKESIETDIKENVEQTKEAFDIMNNTYKELYRHYQNISHSSFFGSFIWRIEKVNEKLEKCSHIYSPPFKSDPNGYKMCFSLMFGNEKGSHLSIYMQLLPSDYDNILRFPFPHVVEITLIDLKSGNGDYVRFIQPLSQGQVPFERPFSKINPPVGFSNYITRDKLISDYIKLDCMFIRFNVLK